MKRYAGGVKRYAAGTICYAAGGLSEGRRTLIGGASMKRPVPQRSRGDVITPGGIDGLIGTTRLSSH